MPRKGPSETSQPAEVVQQGTGVPLVRRARQVTTITTTGGTAAAVTAATASQLAMPKGTPGMTQGEKVAAIAAAALVAYLGYKSYEQHKTAEAAATTTTGTAAATQATATTPPSGAAVTQAAPQRAGPALQLTSITTGPARVGEPLDVTAWVYNQGDQAGSTTVSGIISLNGVVQGHLQMVNATLPQQVQPGAYAGIALRSLGNIAPLFAGRTLLVSVSLGGKLLRVPVGRAVPTASVQASAPVSVPAVYVPPTVQQAMPVAAPVVPAPVHVAPPPAPSPAPSNSVLVASLLSQAIQQAASARSMASVNVVQAEAHLYVANAELAQMRQYGATTAQIAAATNAVAAAAQAILAARQRATRPTVSRPTVSRPTVSRPVVTKPVVPTTPSSAIAEAIYQAVAHARFASQVAAGNRAGAQADLNLAEASLAKALRLGATTAQVEEARTAIAAAANALRSVPAVPVYRVPAAAPASNQTAIVQALSQALAHAQLAREQALVRNRAGAQADLNLAEASLTKALRLGATQAQAEGPRIAIAAAVSALRSVPVAPVYRAPVYRVRASNQTAIGQALSQAVGHANLARSLARSNPRGARADLAIASQSLARALALGATPQQAAAARAAIRSASAALAA